MPDGLTDILIGSIQGKWLQPVLRRAFHMLELIIVNSTYSPLPAVNVVAQGRKCSEQVKQPNASRIKFATS